MILKRTAVLALAIAIAVPVASRGAAAGVVINSHEFLIAEAHTWGYAYRIVAWKGGEPEQSDRVRVLVHRFSWLTGEGVIDDATFSGDALRHDEDGGLHTIRLQATMPVTGEFDIALSGWGSATKTWSGGVSETIVVESARETITGVSNQTAGGEATGWLESIWGLRAHGLIAWQ